VNVNGGAIAPRAIRSAPPGARLMITLLHELERRGRPGTGCRRCAKAAGQANVTIIERL